MTAPAATTEADELTLIVRSMTVVADGILGLRLERADGGELPAWTPGAHIDLRLPNGVERQYSLCSDPADRSGWEIAVLREDVSRGGSRFVHDALRPGQIVRSGHPLNTFELTPSVDGQETLFIAGGIGITALLPMIAAVAAEGRPVRVAYLGRSRSRMAYVTSELLAASNSSGSGGSSGSGSSAIDIVAADERDRLDLASWIGTPVAGARIYACGPARLLDDLEAMSKDWPRGTLRVERFQPKTFADAGDGESFDVEARRSGLRVTVDAGCSILEMLEQAGIGVPSSCLEGVCGTCETAIVDGEAEHRDSILSSDEQEANETMMICVSRSKTPTLVLDI